MNIIVPVKQVPDTETVPLIDLEGRWIREEGVNFCLNPYDEYAVEEAVRIKESLNNIEETKVVLISIGPERSRSALLSGLAMGADEAIFYLDPEAARFDSFQVSSTLSKIILNIKFDLIICGKRAVDDDNCQVGQMLAEFLKIPQATFVINLRLTEDRRGLVVEREIENGVEALEMELPCLVTAEKGLNIPRFPSLTNIIKAKKKPIAVLTSKDTEAPLPKLEILELNYPRGRRACKIINGEPEDAVRELIRLLKQDSKAI